MADVKLKAGDVAPEFELQADDGSTVRLLDFRGRRVVVYFYPKDDTTRVNRVDIALGDGAAGGHQGPIQIHEQPW